jgi:hypothetical protein
MKSRIIQQTISLIIVVALSIAFGDSRAIAENAPGIETYKRDLENLEYHLLDTGHFANRRIQSPKAAN